MNEARRVAHRSRRLLLHLLLWLLLTGCALPGLTIPSTPATLEAGATAAATVQGAGELPVSNPNATATVATATVSAPEALPTATQPLPTPLAVSVDAAAIDAGPFQMDGSYCGLQLPVMAAPVLETTQPIAEVDVLAQVPAEAHPALEFLFANPSHVGLAAFETGREAEGLYLNADNPLPLASVVKVLHLVAYAEAVQFGELDPVMVVPLGDLERYYLPNSDLGSHPRSVATLVEEGRVFGEPPSVLLEDVPRMMMEFSSNAATDYLHMLLGQERIEATSVALGMSRQTAPCPFLGQFLLMGARADGLAPIWNLIDNPQQYSRNVMALTEQYSSDAAFRNQLGAWVERANRPSIEAQQLFSERLNAHGTAREYANLMAQIALNSMGPWEESVRVRRYMEWPTHFPTNQERLAWLGYKGGSLPGVLTVVYYAQPWDTVQPVVVALFFHDLPTDVYRDWRRTLPHDELARWLLRDRQAIPLLRELLN